MGVPQAQVLHTHLPVVMNLIMGKMQGYVCMEAHTG